MSREIKNWSAEERFVERFFGKNHQYKVYDGTYGDWMESSVDYEKQERDYEVDTLHIEIGSWKWNDTWGMQVIYFKIVRAEATLPSIELHEAEEQKNWDFSSSRGFDCSYDQLWAELKTMVTQHDDDYRAWSLENEGDNSGSRVYLDVRGLPGEYLDKDCVPDLDELNGILNEMKEIIDSHKKK